MATQVKATTKNSSRMVTGANRDNKPAEAYDKRGASSADAMADSSYKTGAQVMNEMNLSIAGISKGSTKPTKTDGVKIRGTGAATKGVMARGPMA
jgi:hypothetical protein